MTKIVTLLFGLWAASFVAQAQVTFYSDRTSFLADARITAASKTNITFDSYSPGTNLTGATDTGATFNAPGSSPLIVIAGSTGVRFAMSPSSGLNVLSPGGSSTGLEDDDLNVTFAVPVQAAGIDVVFDVPDGASFVAVYFHDVGNNLLFSNGFIPAPSGAPGYQFIGLVADTPLIARMFFDEYEGSAPDDHVAYDSLIFTTTIPEPSAAAAMLALFGAGAALAWRRKLPRTPQS